MRQPTHDERRSRHNNGVIDRVVGYVSTAQKVYGVAHAAYQVGRYVAPYVAAAVA